MLACAAERPFLVGYVAGLGEPGVECLQGFG